MPDAVTPRVRLVIAALLALELLVFNGMDISLGAFPLHAVEVGAGPAMLGGLTVVWFLGAILTRTLAVQWSRRFGLWSLLLLSTIVMGVGPALYVLAANPWELGVARVLYAPGPAAMMVAIPALLASLAPTRLRGNVLGWYGAVASASLLYAPAVGIRLFERAGAGLTYGVAAGAGLLAAGLGVYGRLTAGRDEAAPQTGQSVCHRPDGQGRLGLIGAFGVGACFSAVMGFLALYARQRGTDPELALVVLAAFAVAARLLSGRLLEGPATVSVAVAGSVMLLIGSLMLAWASAPMMLLAGGAATGVGQAMAQTALLKHAVDHAGPSGGVVAVAWFFNSNDLGMALGALLFGILAERFSYGIGYGIFAVGGACLALFLNRLREGPESLPLVSAHES